MKLDFRPSLQRRPKIQYIYALDSFVKYEYIVLNDHGHRVRVKGRYSNDNVRVRYRCHRGVYVLCCFAQNVSRRVYRMTGAV